MMNKDCENYQSKLIDIFYNEENINEEVLDHMESCDSCKKYWDNLHEIKVEMDKCMVDQPIEYSKISQAFTEVENIKVNRRNIFDLALFIVISGLLLGLVGFVAVKGYLVEFIYFQIAMYIIIPLSLPIFIKMRSLKEGYNE